MGHSFWQNRSHRDNAPHACIITRWHCRLLPSFLFVLRKQRFTATPTQMGQFLILGMLNNIIPFGLIFLDKQKLAQASPRSSMPQPLLDSYHRFGPNKAEAPSLKTTFGIICGIMGVAVLIGPELIFESSGPLAETGDFGATLSYGFAAVFAKHVSLGTPENIATGQLTASTLWMVPILFITEGMPNIVGKDFAFWSSVVLLATLCTAFAYILYFQILAMAGATNTSLVTLIVPASAIVLGVFFLNEVLKAQEYIGMAIIALGLIIIDGRLFARYRKP